MKTLVTFAGILSLCAAQGHDWGDVTPLDEYVSRDDSFKDLELVDTAQLPGCDVYIYNLTSQRWMDESYINHPVWWHHLTIAIPTDPVIFDTAHLDVTGGSLTSPVGSHLYICTFATETGAVTARVQQVPNQPMSFFDDPDIDKSEDDLIARTIKHYIEYEGDDPNPDVLLLMPMVKAGKVAMDFVIEEANRIDPRFQIEHYIPSGISKRGWVSWLLAGVDPRVTGVAPTVLDLLNYQDSIHHIYQAYGGWPFAHEPYWLENCYYNVDHPRNLEIANDLATDAISYNPRLTMPKLLSLATADGFFLPDDTHYFWDELTPPKLMTMYENAGHGMAGQTERRDANIRSFFIAVTRGFDLPEISWTRTETEDEGYIDVTTDRAPNMIQSWWADTTEMTCEDDGDGGEICRRDYRQLTVDVVDNPVTWVVGPVEDMGENSYRATYDQRDDVEDERGYRGFFVQMEFDGVDGHILDVTTEVQIMPDTFPFDRCGSPEECHGTLK